MEARPLHLSAHIHFRQETYRETQSDQTRHTSSGPESQPTPRSRPTPSAWPSEAVPHGRGDTEGPVGDCEGRGVGGGEVHAAASVEPQKDPIGPGRGTLGKQTPTCTPHSRDRLAQGHPQP